MKHTTDPPLYSALLKTLNQLENIKKENRTIEVPVYEKYTSVIPEVINSELMNLYLFKYEHKSEIPSAPTVTNVKVKQRTVKDLITGSEGWTDLWNEQINGEVYIFSKTFSGQDLAFVYKAKHAQNITHVIRYYPDYNFPFSHDLILPGSYDLQAFSIHNNILVYVLKDGFFAYHYAKIVTKSEKFELEEISTGDLVDRTVFRVNEVSGLKIVNFNNTFYLIVSKVIQYDSAASARVLLNLFVLESENWKSLGNLYNVSISEYVSGFDKSYDVMVMPRIRISANNSMLIGHYGNILMYVRYFDDAFEAYYISAGFAAEFNILEIAETGEFVLMVRVIKTIPGHYEHERLRFVRVNSSGDAVQESSIDVALDHLPYPLMEKSIKNVKLINFSEKMYVVVFCSNGAMVVIDFDNEIHNMDLEDWDQSITGKGFSVLLCLAFAFYTMFGRRLLIRRINNPE